MQMKNRRWFWLIVELMCLIWIAFPALAAEKKNLVGKVAVVNGSLITQEEIARTRIIWKRETKAAVFISVFFFFLVKKK